MDVARRHGFPAPNPVGPDGRYTEAVGPWAGRAVRKADPALVADLAERGLLLRAETHRHQYPHCWRCGAAPLHAKPSWYVRDRGRRPDAGAQPPHRLAPRARARRPLRPVARGQRRLVDLARPLLGHAAAPLALRRLRPHRRRRLLRGAARPRGPGAAGALRPAPAVRGRGRADLRLRRRHGARARGHRRLVRQRRDAVRPGPPPVRHGRGPGGALPGRLHLRGPRPDAGLVLLPARREHPPLRRGGLPPRRLPGPDARRRGPEDEQEQGQRHRAGTVLDRQGPTFRWYS